MSETHVLFTSLHFLFTFTFKDTHSVKLRQVFYSPRSNNQSLRICISPPYASYHVFFTSKYLEYIFSPIHILYLPVYIHHLFLCQSSKIELWRELEKATYIDSLICVCVLHVLLRKISYDLKNFCISLLLIKFRFRKIVFQN